ncbi:I78 family peptidase inhibitor [Paracoccaceae bacterium GXU_MW_L88]
MTRFALLLVPLALIACQPVPTAPTSPATPNAPSDSLTCLAPNYQSWVGQDQSVITNLPSSLRYRVIRPGDAVTMDYRVNRVNFLVNEAGTITEVKCY